MSITEIKEKIDILIKLFALLISTIYVCGFIVFNTHLNIYGIYDFNITNSNYLVSGAIFFLFIVTYGLFGGRSIVLMKKWMSSHINTLKKVGHTSSGPIIGFIYSFIELTFFHCISSAIFYGYAIDGNSLSFYVPIFSLTFIIVYIIDITDINQKYPMSITIIEAILKIIVIYSFFMTQNNSDLMVIFGIFFCFSMYINLVLDNFERNRNSSIDNLLFTLIYSIVFFFGSAIIFGMLVYGNISKNIGGGKSPIVEITLNNQDNQFKETYFSGQVIYKSTENIYIKTKKEILSLSSSEVKLIKYPSPRKDTISNTFKKIINNENNNTH